MVLACLGCVINYDWRNWSRNGHEFSVLRSGTECWKIWAVSDIPHTVWRLLKIVPICLIGPKMSMCYLHDIA